MRWGRGLLNFFFVPLLLELDSFWRDLPLLCLKEVLEGKVNSEWCLACEKVNVMIKVVDGSSS